LREALLNRVRDRMRSAQRRPTDVLATDHPADRPSQSRRRSAARRSHATGLRCSG
jgi:hypothetical protein